MLGEAQQFPGAPRQLSRGNCQLVFAASQQVMCKHNVTVCSLAAWLKTMLTNAGTGTSALSLLRAALSLGELSQDRSGPLPVQGLAHCSNRW